MLDLSLSGVIHRLSRVIGQYHDEVTRATLPYEADTLINNKNMPDLKRRLGSLVFNSIATMGSDSIRADLLQYIQHIILELSPLIQSETRLSPAECEKIQYMLGGCLATLLILCDKKNNDAVTLLVREKEEEFVEDAEMSEEATSPLPKFKLYGFQTLSGTYSRSGQLIRDAFPEFKLCEEKEAMIFVFYRAYCQQLVQAHQCGVVERENALLKEKLDIVVVSQKRKEEQPEQDSLHEEAENVAPSVFNGMLTVFKAVKNAVAAALPEVKQDSGRSSPTSGS